MTTTDKTDSKNVRIVLNVSPEIKRLLDVIADVEGISPQDLHYRIVTEYLSDKRIELQRLANLMNSLSTPSEPDHMSDLKVMGNTDA